MVRNWDTYSRQGLDLASSAASFGFSAAKTGTKLGFAITRGIASTAVGITTSVVDYTLFGGLTVTRPVARGAVSTVLTLAEQITLAPIHLSEYITSTSLLAAHSSINVLSVIFPGSSEASFSLASFITLVKREWSEPLHGDRLPQKQFGITQVARAIIAWVALQGVTQEWQEKRWLKHLKEINVNEPPKTLQDSLRTRRGSRIRVISDVIFADNRSHIITADIGVAPPRAQTIFTHKAQTTRSTKTPAIMVTSPRQLPIAELKATLRRLSKMVLAGYGGASLLFFGVPLTSAAAGRLPSGAPQVKAEEAQLTNAVNASEAEAAGDVSDEPEKVEYSWWDVLLGRHDHEIFEKFAQAPDDKMKADIKIGREHLMPRFWVLADHSRGQVVLVLRGTMSLNEIAVDLTCDSEEFEPATTETDEEMESPVPGRFIFPRTRSRRSSNATLPSGRYHVHSGMLRMARAMGEVGKPVQLAVHEALYKNPGYELVLCGHSLGAGVAALLGLMWADPKTCMTVHSSGLPVGRRVSVYCFAPPALTDASLSRLASHLVVSFVYSHDVVSRLSLGSVRDLKNAAMWLCDANEGDQQDAGYTSVTDRASRWKAGNGLPEDPQWFIAVRKTLEANMQMAHTFPPGRVLWALRESDLHPSHRTSDSANDKLRLFEVLDVEKVFSQIVFAKDMLGTKVIQTARQILHQDGLRGLWRGTSATLIRNVPGVALYMTSLTQLRTFMATSPYFAHVRELPDNKHASVLPKLSSQGNLISGAVARVGVGFIMNPFSVLKARFESNIYAYESLSGAFVSIARAGPPELLRGFTATSLRDAPYAGLFVVFYEAFKRQASIVVPPNSNSQSTIIHSVSAASAGALATMATHPFDVIKTKLQVRSEDRYHGFTSTVKTIWKHRGIVGYFEGASLRLSRKVLSSAIGWAVYECILLVLRT
ncbi:hypothetical protein VNI00_004824 [Paramarasmius palmivorus]|uniref:Fungal lipase-type domain-containing protein n=1 Tax=Paramarasmius palmivorus TaxID=297713 RepID=A0AAW0DF19_9AGAR